MKAHVISIGMVDKIDKVHYVEFGLGVNIITGKSSTGKSAILEIFDYCMGSSENNIPHGKITQHGTWFFTILSLNLKYLVVARNLVDDSRYINEVSVAPNPKDIDSSYFKEDYQIRDKKKFNPELGRYFNLTIDDIEEDLEDREYRKNNARKGRPSIRNIMPFLLQHQNLIANKHAIFYRFDENKKREDTIDQFKIFVGFVKGEYFSLKQQLSNLIREKKAIERLITKNESEESIRIARIKSILDVYFATTNTPLFLEQKATAEYIYQNHKRYLRFIADKNFNTNNDTVTDGTNDNSLVDFNTLLDSRVDLEAKKRTLLHKALDVERTINYTETVFIPSASKSSDAFSSTIYSNSQCYFCSHDNNNNYKTANKLNNALVWLNTELSKTNYQIDSFRHTKAELDSEIKEIDGKLKKVKKEIAEIRSIEEKLKNKEDLDNQASRYVGRLEEYLESLDSLSDLNDKNYDNIIKDIEDIESQLKEEFNVDSKIRTAEAYINKQMNKIGEKFDFEEDYKPINLKFSLSNFDLYYKTDDDKKIYLRSMGSGANWLYSHLSLFLALHRYFCKIGDKSVIPPILFIDQPTQVYFPTNIEDNSNEFDAQDLVEKRGKPESLDADMKSVKNIFEQLVQFCKDTKDLTGIEPQIIITDHADGLTLDNVTFDDLVVARWRDRGFIYPLPNESVNIKSDDISKEQMPIGIKGEQLNFLDPPTS